MPRSFQNLLWWLAAATIAACYLLADMHAFRGREAAAAVVHGQPISQQELQESMREHLWKHDHSWASLDPVARKNTRWLALENLVNDRLVRACRTKSMLNTDTSRPAAKRESERMQRQFADAAEFPGRLAAQQLTPQSLEARIYAAQLDEAWIAEQIQPRLNELTQQDVQHWYDEFKEALRIPPAHHAAHIFLTRHDKTKPDREPEIREIHRQLLAHEKTFTQLAKKHSDDARSSVLGGDLGWFTQERMPADFIAAVQKLKIGQPSAPVQTQLGWHLIRVLERHASRLSTFEEAKVEITALLISQRREQAVQSLLTELRENSQRQVVYHTAVIDHAEPAP
ncbi:peptidylprolyl isomerase [Prosthecobacter sp.]|uniref:peptidylprolyl isomerase n=1 Tax=Prosthecobacter sp. TaxID=1965333 RepID=UPI00248890A9|nr:peptidylprolyl isomerase [Prosthecobacter sp.]MDI1311531.1 peptidylprolyl isomerase [Prosthecobacter sp.]